MKILVVGGSGGIGEAVLRVLAKEKHELFFTYHGNAAKAAELEKTAAAKKIAYDFSSEDSIAKLVKLIGEQAFDGLVYAAAEKFNRETILKTPAKVFLEYVHKSVSGYYQVSQSFAQSAKNRKSPASLVNLLSSVAIGLPPAKQSSYVSAKYLLLGLMRCQAVEFGAWGVRVNAVSPGMTKTGFISDLPEKFIELYAETLPMRRLVEPQEVAQVVRFLLSTEASHLNGVNIPVSGGQSC